MFMSLLIHVYEHDNTYFDNYYNKAKKYLDNRLYMLLFSHMNHNKQHNNTHNFNILFYISVIFKIIVCLLQEMRQSFINIEKETISFCGTTYCLKQRSTDQIIAFNGPNYLIISRTEVTYVAVICSSKQLCSQVEILVGRIARSLKERRC